MMEESNHKGSNQLPSRAAIGASPRTNQRVDSTGRSATAEHEITGGHSTPTGHGGSPPSSRSPLSRRASSASLSHSADDPDSKPLSRTTSTTFPSPLDSTSSTNTDNSFASQQERLLQRLQSLKESKRALLAKKKTLSTSALPSFDKDTSALSHPTVTPSPTTADATSYSPQRSATALERATSSVSTTARVSTTVTPLTTERLIGASTGVSVAPEEYKSRNGSVVKDTTAKLDAISSHSTQSTEVTSKINIANKSKDIPNRTSASRFVSETNPTLSLPKVADEGHTLGGNSEKGSTNETDKLDKDVEIQLAQPTGTDRTRGLHAPKNTDRELSNAPPATNKPAYPQQKHEKEALTTVTAKQGGHTGKIDSAHPHNSPKPHSVSQFSASSSRTAEPTLLTPTLTTIPADTANTNTRTSVLKTASTANFSTAANSPAAKSPKQAAQTDAQSQNASTTSSKSVLSPEPAHSPTTRSPAFSRLGSALSRSSEFSSSTPNLRSTIVHSDGVRSKTTEDDLGHGFLNVSKLQQEKEAAKRVEQRLQELHKHKDKEETTKDKSSFATYTFNYQPPSLDAVKKQIQQSRPTTATDAPPVLRNNYVNTTIRMTYDDFIALQLAPGSRPSTAPQALPTLPTSYPQATLGEPLDVINLDEAHFYTSDLRSYDTTSRALPAQPQPIPVPEEVHTVPSTLPLEKHPEPATVTPAIITKTPRVADIATTSTATAQTPTAVNIPESVTTTKAAPVPVLSIATPSPTLPAPTATPAPATHSSATTPPASTAPTVSTPTPNPTPAPTPAPTAPPTEADPTPKEQAPISEIAATPTVATASTTITSKLVPVSEVPTKQSLNKILAESVLRMWICKRRYHKVITAGIVLQTAIRDHNFLQTLQSSGSTHAEFPSSLSPRFSPRESAAPSPLTSSLTSSASAQFSRESASHLQLLRQKMSQQRSLQPSHSSLGLSSNTPAASPAPSPPPLSNNSHVPLAQTFRIPISALQQSLIVTAIRGWIDRKLFTSVFYIVQQIKDVQAVLLDLDQPPQQLADTDKVLVSQLQNELHSKRQELNGLFFDHLLPVRKAILSGKDKSKPLPSVDVLQTHSTVTSLPTLPSLSARRLKSRVVLRPKRPSPAPSTALPAAAPSTVPTSSISVTKTEKPTSSTTKASSKKLATTKSSSAVPSISPARTATQPLVRGASSLTKLQKVKPKVPQKDLSQVKSVVAATSRAAPQPTTQLTTQPTTQPAKQPAKKKAGPLKRSQSAAAMPVGKSDYAIGTVASGNSSGSLMNTAPSTSLATSVSNSTTGGPKKKKLVPKRLDFIEEDFSEDLPATHPRTKPTTIAAPKTTTLTQTAAQTQVPTTQLPQAPIPLPSRIPILKRQSLTLKPSELEANGISTKASQLPRKFSQPPPVKPSIPPTAPQNENPAPIQSIAINKLSVDQLFRQVVEEAEPSFLVQHENDESSIPRLTTNSEFFLEYSPTHYEQYEDQLATLPPPKPNSISYVLQPTQPIKPATLKQSSQQ